MGRKGPSDEIFGSGAQPERSGRAFESMRGQLLADFDAIVRDAEQLLRAATETSRQHPLSTVTAVAATGAAIGFIIGRITRH